MLQKLREEVKENKRGITLIALVITVIIMLILAGIIISQLTGENGLIAKAQLVKERTEYGIAKEEIEIKLEEVVLKCETEGIDYTIEEIAKAIEEDDEKLLEKYFGTGTASVTTEAKEENILNLSDIVISVKKYSKYKFLVGQTEEGTTDVKGVTIGEITSTTTIAEFEPIAKFEKILTETPNKEYTIKYHANGGTGSIDSQNKREGLSVVIKSASQIKREGYSFVGWFENAEGEGKKYEVGSIIKAEKDLELYAKWSKNVYTIEYYANNGTTNKINVEVAVGDGTTLLGNTAFSNTGFELTKWNTKSDGNGTSYALEEEIVPEKDMELYAQWGVTSSSVKNNPSTFYGKKVNYTGNSLNNWKIFYADDRNIFLIYGDYLPNNKVNTTKSAMTTYRSYEVYWGSYPSSLDSGWSTYRDSFLTKSYNFGDYPNHRCVAKLLNTDNWTYFVDGIYADLAIGSPTLEMWKNSWDNLYPSNVLFSISTGNLGYKVSVDGDKVQKTPGYNNTLYFPHPSTATSTVWNNCEGYWIASPHNNGGDYVVMIGNGGSIGLDYYNGSGQCLRPVIRLKNTTQLVPSSVSSSGYDYDLK